MIFLYSCIPCPLGRPYNRRWSCSSSFGLRGIKIFSKNFSAALSDGGILFTEDWMLAADKDPLYIKLSKESPALQGGIFYGNVDKFKYGQVVIVPHNDPVPELPGGGS